MAIARARQPVPVHKSIILSGVLWIGLRVESSGFCRGVWQYALTKSCWILVLVVFLLLTSHFLLPASAAADKWGGVDESVVEKYAEEHGRTARAPFINTDQGDLLLFVFLLATCVFQPATVVNAEIVDRIVAVVNDSAITLSELNAAAAGLEVAKGADKERMKKIIEAKGKILDLLIEKKLVEQSANKAGITVSEKEVDNTIEDVKRQNNIGQEELLSALAKSGLTFRGYREQIKAQIRQAKFIDNAFRSNIRVSDEDVEAYFMQHKERFSVPVMHRLRIISFHLAEQNIPFYLTEQNKRDVEKKAMDVIAMARMGEDFGKLASAYSQGPNAQDGGDMGYVREGEMDPAIENVVAGLKVGEVSNTVKTSTGFHIIQLIDRRKGETRPLSEVREEIKNIIFRRISEEKYKLWLDEMRKKAYIEVRL